MEQPKVSVVVPIYNVENYLKECLDSIKSQSLESIEVVMVDDGSTDGSAEIAKGFAEDDNRFVYYLKSNGGLGQARNYGADRATGEYLCFCDSDDTIPPSAYEHLYDLAKKYDCDFVTGDMQRFNSKKTYASSLHRIAYRNACELMNIRTHPEILFDSTTPNKMFRRAFFVDAELRFPEGMLYEDIPVNTPIFCITEKYAHLDEVVYNWRARDKGEERSITQRRAEWSNFSDRFKAMKMVDEYFEEHVTDQELIDAKDFKWLRLDLRIYIDIFRKVDGDYREDFLNMVAPYLANINQSVFDKLDVAERVKYHFFRECELKKLMQFISFTKSAAWKSFPIIEKDGRYYGKFPFEGLPLEMTDLTDEIQRQGCKVKVDAASFAGDEMHVEGDMFLGVLPAASEDDIEIETHLVTALDESEAALVPSAIYDTDHPRVDDTHSIKKRTIRRLKREKIRYSLDLPWETIKGLPDGKYLFRVAYRRESLLCPSVYVAWPSAKRTAHPAARFVDGRRYYVSYDAGERLCLNISTEESTPADRIDSDGCVVSLYAGNTLLETLDVEALTAIAEADPSLDNQKPYYNSNKISFLPVKDHVVRCWASTSGELEVEVLPDGVLAEESWLDGSIFTYIIRELRPGQLDGSWNAFLRGKRHKAEYAVPGTFEAKDGIVACSIYVGDDEALRENLRADFYELYLRKGEESFLHSLPVFAQSDISYNNELVNIGRMRYALTESFKAGFRVSRPWKRYENTKHKRTVLWNRLYMPLYKVMRRVLPLKKNMVLFESYWGEQTGCNPGGLYRYIDSAHPEFDCRWSLVDDKMQLEGNAKRLRKGSLGYMYALARAKYLVSNVNFENWYVKKKGQIEIQTTHGTPLKKVGFASQEEFTARGLKNFGKRRARWNYLVTPGPRTEEILADNYRYDKDFLETGFPRNDYLFENNTPEQIAVLKEKYGIPADAKVVLYAPTWREAGVFDLELDLSAIVDALGDEYVFAIRVHHFAASGVKDGMIDERVIDLTMGPTSEECYLIADVLITDYSSLMFDYAVLDRPMIFYVYDLEDYRDNLRGFNFDFESDAPGPLLRTTEEVIEALGSLDDMRTEYAEAFENFKQAYCGFENGNAGEQIFNAVMKRRP